MIAILNEKDPNFAFYPSQFLIPFHFKRFFLPKTLVQDDLNAKNELLNIPGVRVDLAFKRCRPALGCLGSIPIPSADSSYLPTWALGSGSDSPRYWGRSCEPTWEV